MLNLRITADEMVTLSSDKWHLLGTIEKLSGLDVKWAMAVRECGTHSPELKGEMEKRIRTLRKLHKSSR